THDIRQIHRLVLRAGRQLVELLDIFLVVLAMVEIHRSGRYVWLERRLVVWERRKRKWHVRAPSRFGHARRTDRFDGLRPRPTCHPCNGQLFLTSAPGTP